MIVLNEGDWKESHAVYGDVPFGFFSAHKAIYWIGQLKLISTKKLDSFGISNNNNKQPRYIYRDSTATCREVR